MRRLLPLSLLGVLACGGGGGGEWGSGGEGFGGKHGKKREPVTVVEVVEVGRGSVADVLQSSAVVESEAMADLFPATTGVVVSLHADEGDAVEQGDLLAVLDNVSLDVGAQRTTAEVRRLQEQYDELAALASRGAVSDRELQDLAYQLETARLSAREARNTQGQTRITAPFDGVVAARDVRVGELANSGRAAFKIVDLESLRVITSLPERDLPRIALGQPARLTSAYHEDTSASGQVVRVAPVIDAGSGTFRVHIDVDDQGVLRPGQFVSVALEVDRHDDVVVVPKRALVWEDGRPVVFVRAEPTAEELEKAASPEGEGPKRGGGGFSWPWSKREDPEGEGDEEEPDTSPPWVARRTPVEVGLVDADNAEITSGLEPGATVVTVGQSHLRDGARIRVAEPGGEANAAAADAEDDVGEAG